MSPPTPPKAHRRLPTESSAPEDNGFRGPVDAAPESPSPPPPSTPDSKTTTVADVRVKQPDSHRQQGSVVLSEGNDFAPPMPEGKPLSRRTATLSRAHRDAEHSESSATEPSSRAATLRRKRFPPRLQSLRNSRGDPVPPMPAHVQTLDVPADEHEHEGTATPRAQSFDDATPTPAPRRTRKISNSGADGESPRPRKISNEGRTRKISTEGRRKVSAERDPKNKRESSAVEGDDEGYNDLLSAYESEDA